MPRLDSQKMIEIHQSALKQFDSIQSALREEREQCLQDRRFYSISGAQWEGDLEEQFENKPKFEVNKIHLSVIRIINEYRNNRITVDFVSKEGEEYDALADTADGRYRADEDASGAQEAYDNAFEEACAGGFGAWRLRAEYEDEEDDENEYQKICIEPIFDADTSVYFDLNAKRQDKSDAKNCYVLTSIPRDTYKEEYDDDPSSWPKEVHEREFDWATPDVVFLCEYYKVEMVRRTVEIWKFPDGKEERYDQSDFKDNPELFGTLTAVGAIKDREKKTTRKKVRKLLMSGSRVLEDEGYINGSCIPIVPVYGKRWYVDNVERCMGHVRLAKDAQRLKNMQLSRLGEISALSPVEKPIFLPEQIAGHQEEWREDNILDYPYLLVNSITDQNGNSQPAGPVGYTKPPQVPPALAALLQLTEQDMQDLLGNQQAGEEMQPNMSGKAVELIQTRLDMQTFIYISNMAKAIKRSGEIWLSMARDIYVEEGRHLKILNAQKESENVELLKPYIEQESGELKYENDFSEAKFDLSVQVGPSTSSKRAATVRALTGLMQVTQDPQDTAMLSALAMMNMEGEGISDVRKYQRKKLIRMGVIEPNEEEQKELQAEMEAAAAQQQNAEQQYLQALSAESMAKAQKAQADTVLTAAKAEETKAKTAETLSKMSREEQKSTVSTIKDITEIQNQQVPAPPQIG